MKNFLIVKLSAIGDVIHALPVAYALKEKYPDCHVTWVVEPPAYDLVKMSPHIDEVILFEKKKFKKVRGFLREYGPLKRKIQSRSYDAALDLQGLFKSAAIARLAKAPVKLGMCNMRELSDRISKPVIGPHAEGHIVERYLDVARALDCPVNEVRFTLEVPEREQSLARQLFAQAGGNMDNPFVALAIGANWPNKRWPTENFAKLADFLYDRQLIPVLVGGGLVDEQRAAEICSAMEIPPLNLTGRTNFKQLAYLLQQARLCLGGDTGPVHLASGLGTPTIMVMGPTDANRNGPYGQPANAIEVDRPCRYCWQRSCPKQLDCLANITVEQVKKKIKEILQCD